MLRVNQQPYLSVSAQYRVLIDGAQYGGIFTASATRASGLTDTLTLLGTFAAGSHAVRVEFLNDAYGGSAALDRNLYLVAATFNSVNIPGAPKDILGPNETAIFSFTKGAIIVPPPPAGPALTLFSRARTPLISGRRPLAQAPANIASVAPVDQSTTIDIGTGSDVLVLRITQDAWEGSARYTVSVDGVRIGAELEAVALRGRTLVRHGHRPRLVGGRLSLAQHQLRQRRQRRNPADRPQPLPGKRDFQRHRPRRILADLPQRRRADCDLPQGRCAAAG